MSDSITDDPQATRAENRLALRIILALLVVVVVAVALVWMFGWPMLGFIGMAATAVVFVVLLAFTAGS